jgi:hypothetical protein
VATVFFWVLVGCRSSTQLAYEDNPELSPLMNAAAHNDLLRVRGLLSQGVDVTQQTSHGETALYEAIERRDLNSDNLPTVDELLKAGADPNEVEFFRSRPLNISLTRDYANPSVTLRLLQAGAMFPRIAVMKTPCCRLRHRRAALRSCVHSLRKGARSIVSSEVRRRCTGPLSMDRPTEWPPEWCRSATTRWWRPYCVGRCNYNEPGVPRAS